jgi:ankyrin repeat protein
MFPNPQDSLPLPARPNLEQYRKLAKQLLKACKSQPANPDSVDDWAEGFVNRLVKASRLKIREFMPVRVSHWVTGLADFIERHMLAPTRAAGSAPLKARTRNGAKAPGSARPLAENRCNLAGAQFVIARAHGFRSWPQLVHHLQSLQRSRSQERDFEAAAEAIITGDVATVKRLLRQNPELARARSAREHNATLLHYVSANGVEGYRQLSPKNSVEIARVLLDAGAEVDAEADVYGGGATTLGLVATSVHPQKAGVQLELLDLLLQHGAAIEHPRAGGNNSATVMACLDNGQPSAAQFLAERGARLDLASAAGLGRIDQVRMFFLPDGSSGPGVRKQKIEAAFRYACGYGHTETAEFLLNKGVDLTAHSGDGQTGLHYAVIFGNLDVVKLLLAHNAPLEVENQYGGTVLGQTLWSAAHGGNSDIYAQIIETLIAAGAKVPERHTPVNAAIDALLERNGSRPEPSWHWFGEEPRRQRKKRTPRS